MAKINIVIADSDELYLNHLTNYLIEQINSFEVYAFTTKESFVKFISDKANKVDVVAFTENFMDESITNAEIPAKILLTDGSFTDLEEFETVNKYQKADKFINDILLIYAEHTGRVEAVSHGNKDVKLVGVYSPVGGCGKTTVAVSVAYALGAMGKRVFYLNAEKINSTASVFNEAPTGTMSDVYLNTKTKGANVGLRIMANKYTDINTNISYINPSESSLEINELTRDEFIKLLKEFEALGEFDVVIVDFDGEFNNDKIEVLQNMDKIIVPFTSDSLSVAKTGLFLKELGMYDELKDIDSKISLVLNKSTNMSASAVDADPYITEKGIQSSVVLTPLFSDLKNLLHSGDAVSSAFAKVVEDI